MQISYNKKNNTVLFESKAGNFVWVPNALTSPGQINDYAGQGIAAVFCSISEAKYNDLQFLKELHLIVDPLLRAGTLVVNSPIDSRIKDVYIKGISDNGVNHFFIQTDECSVLLVNGKISENTVKKFSPVDILVGQSDSIAPSQLDFDPFYVVVLHADEAYSKTTGITDIKVTDKLSVKKIDQGSREGTIDMQVISLS